MVWFRRIEMLPWSVLDTLKCCQDLLQTRDKFKCCQVLSGSDNRVPFRRTGMLPGIVWIRQQGPFQTHWNVATLKCCHALSGSSLVFFGHLEVSCLWMKLGSALDLLKCCHTLPGSSWVFFNHTEMCRHALSQRL